VVWFYEFNCPNYSNYRVPTEIIAGIPKKIEKGYSLIMFSKIVGFRTETTPILIYYVSLIGQVSMVKIGEDYYTLMFLNVINGRLDRGLIRSFEYSSYL